jgi:hypothetical protein
MEKDTARLFGTTVVITAAIVGGAYLLERANKANRPLPPEQATWTELKPLSPRHSGLDPGSNTTRTMDAGSAAGMTAGSTQAGQEPVRSLTTSNIPAETSAEGIIVCQHPEHGAVYTNAAHCDEVDYDNRLTQAEPFQPIPNPDRYKNSDYQAPDRQAANGRSNRTKSTVKNVCDKTVLRLHGRSPPSGLNQSCKFAVGKALEIERSLAVANDPSESAWLDSYCKWVRESVVEDCNLSEVQYCYSRYCDRW